MDNGGIDPQDAQIGQTPPGWYPDSAGMQRWWDGTQWTDSQASMQPAVPAAATDPKTIATLMHVGSIFFGFIAPLVAYLVYPQDPFIRDHSREALNFQITVFIAFLVSAALIVVLIGIFLFPILVIMALVFEIMGAVAANKGQLYKYPINIRFISN